MSHAHPVFLSNLTTPRIVQRKRRKLRRLKVIPTKKWKSSLTSSKSRSRQRGRIKNLLWSLKKKQVRKKKNRALMIKRKKRRL